VKKTRTKKTPPRAAARRRAPAKAKKAKSPRRAPPPPAVVVEPVPEVSLPAEDIATFEPAIITAAPEREFAARAVTVEPDRPVPAARRAIFFDVENTSRAEHIARVIDHLAVDRMGRRTDFVAVGNWKVIGQDTARLLARHGAQLVHSAPSVGVRDWSDLRIAVAAGVWLAGARAGDVMEIVTNDRAFDAVGDVSAGLGIVFRRLSYQGLAGAPVPTPAPAPLEESGRDTGSDGRGRRRRRGRRYGWRDSGASPGTPPPAAREARAPSHPVAPAPPAAPVPPVPPELPRTEAGGNGAEPPPAEPHTAPHDEIIAIVRELIQRSPARTVSIDTLANALKSRGFSRTPGSPRLITRLRRIKEITVSRSGMMALLEAGARAPQPEVPAPLEMPAPIAYVEAPTERIEPPAERTELPAEHAELSAERAEKPAERVGPPTVAAAVGDDTEEPGDSIGNVAPPADAPPPSHYRRPQRGDRRRFPRPQRTSA
jgi:hypothetical protein